MSSPCTRTSSAGISDLVSIAFQGKPILSESEFLSARPPFSFFANPRAPPPGIAIMLDNTLCQHYDVEDVV